MSTATESDDELLASLEPGSFAVFYRRHVEDLVAFFMRRTRFAELAADLTAETFAAALVARARFDPGRGSASAWLFGIALNKLARVERRAVAEWRARRRLGMERIELTDADIERIDALGSGERAHVLLERISPEQRDAIRAHVIDERPYDRALAGDLRGGRAQARQPRPGRRPPANGTTRMSDDFFIRLERQLEAAELRELNRAPALRRLVSARRLLSVPLAAAAAVGVVVVVLAVLGAIDKNDADRRPQPVGTVPAPSMEVVADATAVERGMHFGLDGRVLTVQLLPPVLNQTFETVSGARISATCGANVAAPPGDPRGETTLTRRWGAGQTSTSYRFPRDVSRWCRLEDQSGSIVAFVRFPGPGVPPGASELITETANKWARLFASSPQTCADYMARTACEQVTCQRVGGTRIPGCRVATPEWGAEFRGATVRKIAISGDRAAATFSNHATVQLRRIATGEWLIDRLGPIGAVGSSN
jgi:DNA-directed RNA polymerase specialized sigma24 family protein